MRGVEVQGSVHRTQGTDQGDEVGEFKLDVTITKG